jgi:Enoyl-(Acyl carrier protein) reductase
MVPAGNRASSRASLPVWLLVVYRFLRNEKLLADPVRYRQISDRIPAGRWGDPKDFAGPVVFLASKASQYVCGELLVVDGVSSGSIATLITCRRSCTLDFKLCCFLSGLDGPLGRTTWKVL